LPSIMTHAIVGAAAVEIAPLQYRPLSLRLLAAGLAVLPDLDVLGYAVGVPRGSLWSHRGISHSLAVAFVLGPLLALVAGRRCSLRWLPLALLLSLVAVSHPVLDGLTRGGRGVAYFAPFDTQRYWLPVRLIPGAPLGLAYFSRRGLHAFMGELLWVWIPTVLTVAVVRFRRSLASGGDRLTTLPSGESLGSDGADKWRGRDVSAPGLERGGDGSGEGALGGARRGP
jgi:inner membrane protein